MSLRRANRQIEVFDISLMAVVTKAMGAFLVMMLLLLPYYTGAPPNITSPETARKAVADARQQVAEVTRNAGRFAQDPAELLRRLQAAQAALQKADAAIREMKTQLDQVWSQLTRSQSELAQAHQQLAQDQKTIAALQEELRRRQAQQPMQSQLMAMLDLIQFPTCRAAQGSSGTGSLTLTVEPIFVPTGATQPDKSEGMGLLPMPWVVRKVLSSSDWATNVEQQLLYLPARPGISYVAVSSAQEPAGGCAIAGQVSAMISSQAAADHGVYVDTKAVPLSQQLLNKGPILIAAIDLTGHPMAVCEPTKADIAAWTAAMGGRVPSQPEPRSNATAGPFGPGVPVSKSASGNPPDDARQHLLLRTPSGPVRTPGPSPASPAPRTDSPAGSK